MQLVWNLDNRAFLFAFLSEILFELKKRAERSGESGFFKIEEDIPYISGVLCDGLTGTRLDLRKPYYTHIEPVSLITCSFEKMKPVLARSIADGVVLSLALCQRMPDPFNHSHGINSVASLYGYLAKTYPRDELRPALESMSLDVAVWATILPFFTKEASIVITHT